MSEAVRYERYERDDGVFVLTLNEPATRNAISSAIVEALVEYTGRINADLSVGCVMVTGDCEAFSPAATSGRCGSAPACLLGARPRYAAATYRESSASRW